MSKKKIVLIILGIVIVLVGLMGFNVYRTTQKTSNEVAKLEISNIDLSKVQEGVYEGKYYYDQLLGAIVKVTVKNNEITNIDFVEHKYGLGKKAEAITDNVIKEQSLDVDTISGATSSSTVILKAIENALAE